MSSRFFISLIMLFSCVSCVLIANKPHLYITRWTPGSYGNYPGAGHQRPPLPIYVSATFDSSVTADIINAYIKFLQPHFRQLCSLPNKGEIAFTVLGTTTQVSVEAILNNANRHFDPEYKTAEEVAAAERLKAHFAVELDAMANKREPVPHASLSSFTYRKNQNTRYMASITFDRDVTDNFVRNYFSFLEKANPRNPLKFCQSTDEVGHKIKNNYMIGTSLSQQDFNSLLENANRHFDPEIEIQERIKHRFTELETKGIELQKTKIAEQSKKQKETEAIRLQKAAERAQMIAAIDPDKQERLKRAILANSADEVRLVLQAGAKIDCGINGQPPLLWAILLKKFAAARELLVNGANPNIVYSEKSLICYLVEQGNLDFACILVKHGSDFSGYEETIRNHLENKLHHAFSTNCDSEFNETISLGADREHGYGDILNYYLETKLHNAIMNDSPNDVRQALEWGADKEHGKDNLSPLLWAVLAKKSNAVEELLKHNVHTDTIYTGDNLVHHAMNREDIKSAILLVKAGADFSENATFTPGYYTLMERVLMLFSSNPATRNNCLEFLQELINRGYDLNSANYRMNALYKCLSCVPEKILLEFFIRNGVNTNQLITIDQGRSWTPLFKAIDINNVTVVKILLDAGADVNQKAAPDSLLQMPLFFAINRRSIDEIVSLLIERGASL